MYYSTNPNLINAGTNFSHTYYWPKIKSSALCVKLYQL